MEVTARAVLINVSAELKKLSSVDIRTTHFCSQRFVECTWVCLFYLSRLFTGCLEFSLLASLFDLLVLWEAVGVLSVHRVFLLSQDLSAQNK